MARIFPDNIVDSSELSTISQALCKIFERNLSDEWECHAFIKGQVITGFLILSHDLGALLIYVSSCTLEEFPSLFEQLTMVRQNHTVDIKKLLGQHDGLIDDYRAVKIPVGVGVLFSCLNKEEVDFQETGLERSEFLLFANELSETSDSGSGLESRCYGMVEDIGLNEVGVPELELVRELLIDYFFEQSVLLEVQAHTVLEQKSNKGHVSYIELSRCVNFLEWWNSLPNEWKTLFRVCVEEESINDNFESKLLNLTEFIIHSHNEQIFSLDPLQELINLQDLSVFCEITDISPLRKLTSLKHLIILSSEVENINPLSGLTNLQTLDLSTSNIDNIEPLRNLTNLRELKLSRIPFCDLDPLRGLVNLQTLDLDYNYWLDNIEPLRELLSLKILWLNSSDISDIRPLQQLINLQNLDLSNTNITDIDRLRSLTKLRSLAIINTKVSNIWPLREVISLEKIFIQKTKVTNISLLAKMKNLLQLDISQTSINNIEPLKELTCIQALDLSNTLVSDIKPLCKLTNLIQLGLNGTLVTSIDQLSNMHDLQTLSIDNTSISDIEPLRRIDGLQALFMSNSCVVDFEPISKLRNLKELSATHAGIDNYQEFRKRWTSNVDDNDENTITKLNSDVSTKCNFSFEPFLNHLEFLGYDNTEAVCNDNIIGYICRHNDMVDLSIVYMHNLFGNLIVLMASCGECCVDDESSVILKSKINDINSSMLNGLCFLDTEFKLIIKMYSSCYYVESEFRIFVQYFNHICNNIHSELGECITEN